MHQANRHGGVVPDVSECGALDASDGLGMEDDEEAGTSGPSAAGAACLGDLPSQVVAQTSFRGSSSTSTSSNNAVGGTSVAIATSTSTSASAMSGTAAGDACDAGQSPTSPNGGGGPGPDVGGRVAGVELDEALRAELKSLTHNLPSNVVVTRAAQPKATSRVLCDICLKEVCNKVQYLVHLIRLHNR